MTLVFVSIIMLRAINEGSQSSTLSQSLVTIIILTVIMTLCIKLEQLRHELHSVCWCFTVSFFTIMVIRLLSTPLYSNALVNDDNYFSEIPFSKENEVITFQRIVIDQQKIQKSFEKAEYA